MQSIRHTEDEIEQELKPAAISRSVRSELQRSKRRKVGEHPSANPLQ
jgi:hypothetical protein